MGHNTYAQNYVKAVVRLLHWSNGGEVPVQIVIHWDVKNEWQVVFA